MHEKEGKKDIIQKDLLMHAEETERRIQDELEEASKKKSKEKYELRK